MGLQERQVSRQEDLTHRCRVPARGKIVTFRKDQLAAPWLLLSTSHLCFQAWFSQGKIAESKGTKDHLVFRQATFWGRNRTRTGIATLIHLCRLQLAIKALSHLSGCPVRIKRISFHL